MSKSVAEELAAGRNAAAAEHERTGIIHLTGGELHVKYGVIPWREDRRIATEHQSITDEGERLLRAAADTLIKASQGSIAHVGDRMEDLPPLGLELAGRLGLDGAENDRQVVFMLFPSDRAVMEEFWEHEAWTARVSKGLDEQQAGNSEAASQ